MWGCMIHCFRDGTLKYMQTRWVKVKLYALSLHLFTLHLYSSVKDVGMILFLIFTFTYISPLLWHAIPEDARISNLLC